MTKRVDGRKPADLRPIKVQRRYTRFAPGSVLIQTGNTHVLCTAMIEESVPAWRKGSGQGWITAEYEMLPGSTPDRKSRSRGAKLDGRLQEIQRLIGRAIRSIVDLSLLGERTIWIDCDVLQADGGTRTASITGSYIALADAVAKLMKTGAITTNPIQDSVAAVSVGLVDGRILLDLCYLEDKDAEVDFNVVMTGRGRFVEVQGAAEAGTFDKSQMNRLIAMGESGVRKLLDVQRRALKRK